MTEKIISVKEGKVVEKDGKEWLELVDQEDKTHRVFPAMLGSDGVWVHLDKEIDMLKGKIGDGTINGLGLKLTKEKKGQYWNVIGVELVKDILQEQAAEGVYFKAEANTREQSIETQVAIKEIGECWRLGKLPDDDQLVQAYKSWLCMKCLPQLIPMTYREAKSELNRPDTTEDKPTTGQLSKQSLGQLIDEKVRQGIKELFQHRQDWTAKEWKSTKVMKYIFDFDNTSGGDINKVDLNKLEEQLRGEAK